MNQLRCFFLCWHKNIIFIFQANMLNLNVTLNNLIGSSAWNTRSSLADEISLTEHKPMIQGGFICRDFE